MTLRSRCVYSTGRYPELDAARGIALIAMVAYHTAYDLVAFDLVRLSFWVGFWWWFPRCIAAAFVLLAGLSMTLRRARTADGYRPFLVRGLELLGTAICVTAASYFALGSRSFVFFGVLHLIAFSTLVSYSLVRRPFAAAALGACVLAAGLALGRPRFPGLGLAWLGFRPEAYTPADYLPVFPWYAWFLFGVSLSAFFFPSGKRRFAPPKVLVGSPAVRALAWLGRHTLPIYLIHLPALYGAVWLVSRFL